MTALRDAGRGLALAALALYALNLRAPITALAPVIDDIGADLHLTAAAAGLLTGVPVLCFALTAPLAAVLVGRLGTAAAGTLTLVAVLAGTVLRAGGGFATALAGTVLIGAAITVGNVAVPVVIARDFSSGVSAVTGVTTAAMNAGSVLTTLGTAPLASVIGWRWALVAWSSLVLAALAAWGRAYGFGRRPPTPGGAGRRTDSPPADGPDGRAAPWRAVLRRPLTWLLAATFAAQSASYYGLTAWLPSILHDEVGLSRSGAGAAAALFQGLGVAGGVLAPLALRWLPPRAVTLGIATLWLALPAGLLLAPGAWGLWASFAGVAQAANYAMIFTVIALVAETPAAAGRMSATVQTVGYTFAGLAPTVIGALHTATGSWRAPLLATLAALAGMAITHAVAAGALPRHGRGLGPAGRPGVPTRLARETPEEGQP